MATAQQDDYPTFRPTLYPAVQGNGSGVLASDLPRRTYDNTYPAGPGKRPLYPSPVGIYTPIGSPVTKLGSADNELVQPRAAPTTDAQWNKNIVAGFQSPGQADQDIANRQEPVFSASVDVTGKSSVKPPQPVWTNPDGTTSGYYSQGGKSGGTVMSIPSNAMMGLSPETSRALSGARAAAADRGDFDAIANSYGGNFGTNRGGGGGNAGYIAPNPIGDLIADVRTRMAESANDTSFTGRMTYRNMFNRLTELTKLDQAQQQIGIQGGQLGVAQRHAAVSEAGVPIQQQQVDVGKANANTAYLQALPTAQRLVAINKLIQDGRLNDIGGLEAALKGETDTTKVQGPYGTTVLQNSDVRNAPSLSVPGIPGVPVSPVTPVQFGAPNPNKPLR